MTTLFDNVVFTCYYSIKFKKVKLSSKMYYYDSSFDRLLNTFSLKPTDRVPILEFWPQSQEIIEYVLERPLNYSINSAINGETNSFEIKDAIEFAQRIGMDAVGADFVYWPGQKFGKSKDGNRHYIGGNIKNEDDLKDMEKPKDINELLQKYEYYLEIAKNTNVGIYPRLSAFFNPVYLAMGINDFCTALYDNYKFIEYFMDFILEKQIEIMDKVCRNKNVRFIQIDDDIAFSTGLIINKEMFYNLYIERMRFLIKPAKDNNILIAYHTDGKLDDLMPVFLDLGINAVHPVEPMSNDIFKIKDMYGDKICICGNINLVLLSNGTKEEIKIDVKKHLDYLKTGGGYVCGSSSSLYDGIPPANYLELVKTVHEYGKYE
ncbi:MAG: uroporphyrinogen decarboxylase family protein [Candidatus Humimicrobiaceae bacterium]